MHTEYVSIIRVRLAPPTENLRARQPIKILSFLSSYPILRMRKKLYFLLVSLFVWIQLVKFLIKSDQITYYKQNDQIDEQVLLCKSLKFNFNLPIDSYRETL